MSNSSETDSHPEVRSERLSVGSSRGYLLLHSFLTLLFAALAVSSMLDKTFWLSIFFVFSAIINSLAIPALWKQHSAVKKGAMIFIKPAPKTTVPYTVSLLVTGVLTLLVALTSFGSIAFCYANFTSWIVRLIFGIVNLGLWTFVVFFWYRLITTKRQKPVVESVATQVEGVWPPAPNAQLPGTNNDNEH